MIHRPNTAIIWCKVYKGKLLYGVDGITWIYSLRYKHDVLDVGDD